MCMFVQACITKRRTPFSLQPAWVVWNRRKNAKREPANRKKSYRKISWPSSSGNINLACFKEGDGMDECGHEILSFVVRKRHVKAWLILSYADSQGPLCCWPSFPLCDQFSYVQKLAKKVYNNMCRCAHVLLFHIKMKRMTSLWTCLCYPSERGQSKN